VTNEGYLSYQDYSSHASRHDIGANGTNQWDDYGAIPIVSGQQLLTVYRPARPIASCLRLGGHR